MRSTTINKFIPFSAHAVPVQPAGQVVPIPVQQFTRAGTLITTLTIASALSMGSNMVAVKNGDMNFPQAVLNSLAKGTAATVILNATARSTALQVITTVGVLAGVGFLIDTAMEREKKHPPAISKVP